MKDDIKAISSVNPDKSPVLTETELEAKAKQFYEEWLRDVSAIKSYTEWLDYLSNKAMEERKYKDACLDDDDRSGDICEADECEFYDEDECRCTRYNPWEDML